MYQGGHWEFSNGSWLWIGDPVPAPPVKRGKSGWQKFGNVIGWIIGVPFGLASVVSGFFVPFTLIAAVLGGVEWTVFIGWLLIGLVVGLGMTLAMFLIQLGED